MAMIDRMASTYSDRWSLPPYVFLCFRHLTTVIYRLISCLTLYLVLPFNSSFHLICWQLRRPLAPLLHLPGPLILAIPILIPLRNIRRDEMLVLTQPPLCITNKGFIQPHRNHLPRRHRQQLQKPAPPKLTLESPVFLPVPFPMSPIANHHHSPAQPSPPPTRTGPIQPHISHLPRRRRLHTRHYHALAPTRRKKKLERDMCMQRVASGVWVAFCPPLARDASSPYSSEDDVDEVYRGEEREMGVWDKGLEERFGRVVRIVDAAYPPGPSPCSGLTLTLQGADKDDGVALLTDEQILEGCAFLRTVTTPPSPPPPRYSSFPPTPPPAHSPRGNKNTKEGVLILAPRTRAVDALSLAAAYAVTTHGWKRGKGVDTPPRTPTPSSSSSFTKLSLPDTTFSASLSFTDARWNCEAGTPPSTGNSLNAHPNSNSSREDAREADQDLELDMTHPIAEWSARVIPQVELDDDEEEGGKEYTPVHALLMRLHDSDSSWDRGGEREEEEEEGEGEGGLRDEWRGVLSWEGMWRVWECVRGTRRLKGG